MYTPFICTNNTLGHIDYKIPIVATKSTDYRTSTGSYHDLVPSKGQEFDCRVKARIKPHLKETPVLIRDDNATSLHKESFCWKSNVSQVNEYYPRGGRCDSRNFIRPLQEIVFRKPPRPKGIGLSETKDTYTFKQVEFKQPTVFPPEPYSKCKIASLGKEVQPPIPPAEPGYWKWLDPYMTTNRAHHVPFTTNQWNGVARKDHTTFYVTKGLPKVKGFGPRETVSNEPLVVRREYPMQDSIPFKLKIRGNVVYERSKKCPHSGIDTEYSRNYIHQSFSEIYADVHGNKVVFPESISKASPVQDLCPPAMYCTEYCHIGTGWPVNSVINYGLSKEYLARKKSDCCGKLAT